MNELIDFRAYPLIDVLEILLIDRTTGKNIIWATDPPEPLNIDLNDKSNITKEQVLHLSCLIEPRIAKLTQAQQQRTKKKGEVFTPAWVCNMMNNHCDEVWFGRKDVFNTQEENRWSVTDGKIKFPEGKTWKEYVDSPRLEICCGEAPFLTSRYDAATGEYIEPANRIGILDRKLRIVNEHCNTENHWLTWAKRALMSVYGYEYQGDNLLLARANILLSFCEAYTARFETPLERKELNCAAKIINRNLWQMDGLKKTVPYGKLKEDNQIGLFDAAEGETPPCRIYDWRERKEIEFSDLSKPELYNFN